MFLSNSYVEAVTPDVTVFGDRDFSKQLILNEAVWVGP